jgi:hypothetical protein
VPLAGEIVRAADVTADAWTAFTLTDGGSVNLTIGNGTQDNAWIRLGPTTAAFRIHFVLGSTSAIGGVLTMGPLPFTVVQDQVAAAMLTDASSVDYTGTGLLRTTQILRIRVNGGDVATGTPFTWTTSDVIDITGVCEIT